MPAHNTKLSYDALSSITDLLSSNGGNWGTPRIRESKSNAVISRLRTSSITSDGSDIANSTKANYKESESRVIVEGMSMYRLSIEQVGVRHQLKLNERRISTQFITPL